MKKVVHQINLNDDEFKKVKKNKQSFILQLNDEDNKSIKVKDKIRFLNGKKKIKKKVKDLHTYSTIEEISQNIKNKQLGFKKKETINYNNLIKEFKKDDIKKYGLLGIEIKRKKHIFRKILLVLIVICVIFFGFRFINKKLDEANARKVNNDINKLADSKFDYVFVEINPYLLLSMRNGKVHAVTCLNQDCYKIYNELRLEEKNINESIDTIYNVSKEKGFDVSNGVKVKATGNVKIEEKSHITVEHISESKKDEIISSIKDIKIENTSNEDYYSKLWASLKKDKDYDKTYTCSMNNKELECYFIIDAIRPPEIKPDISAPATVLEFIDKRNEVANTFKKFNIHYTNEDILKVYINNKEYEYAESVEIGSEEVGVSMSYSQTTSDDGTVISESYDIPETNQNLKKKKFNLQIAIYRNFYAYGSEYNYEYLYLKDLNLVNPSASLSKIQKY